MVSIKVKSSQVAFIMIVASALSYTNGIENTVQYNYGGREFFCRVWGQITFFGKGAQLLNITMHIIYDSY